MTCSTTDLFEQAARRASAFRESLATRPPRVEASPAELRASFGGSTPEEGADPAAVIDALADAAEPGLMGFAGPRNFAWVIGGSIPVGVAADMMTSAWGQNSGLYDGSPANAAAEEAASAWLLDMLDLPREASIGFVTGATMANFVGLAAARSEVLARVGWDVEADGLFGAPEVGVFIGADAHSTAYQALSYLGFGRARVKVVPTDDAGRMDADALEAALTEHDGPKIVIAQAGQINTGAFDPFERLPAICKAAGAWLHVDGAFGLWARACPDRAHLAVGLDQADSWATDGHKWLQTPYDCGFAIVRDKAAHQRAMAILASYLPAGEGVYQPAYLTPELSRRARGFAVWAILKALGRRGVAEIVSRHCAIARAVGARLAAEPGIEVLNEVELNQVAVGFSDEAAVDAVVAEVQRANRVLVGAADWKGRRIVRVSVTSAAITEADGDLVAEEIIRAWRQVAPSASNKVA